MSTFQKPILLFSLMAFPWGCASVGLCQERLQTEKVQPLSSAQAVPITEYTLPYYGHGSVDIIDDGIQPFQRYG